MDALLRQGVLACAADALTGHEELLGYSLGDCPTVHHMEFLQSVVRTPSPATGPMTRRPL